MPQDSGLICGARWVQLRARRRSNRGITIVALDPGELFVSVSHHSDDDLFAARDLTELGAHPRGRRAERGAPAPPWVTCRRQMTRESWPSQ
jgi:hypothetical protein